MLATLIIGMTIALIPAPTTGTTDAPTFDRAACERFDDGASYTLCRARNPRVAERQCSAAWERDGDAWWSCVVGLESWRSETQGWSEGGARVTETMPIVDVDLAGRLDWDAI